ncbi:MAG: PPC domain-containing protein [Cyanobacteria bacterium P01_F01_bin.150]
MKKNIKSTLRQASKISLSERSEMIRGRLESNEFSDFYRFKVRSSSMVDVELSGLKRNANVSLYRLKKPFQKVRQRLGGDSFESLPSKRVNRFLDRVAISRRPGKKKEAIEQSLDVGTYLVRVFSRSRKGTRYRLSAVSSPQITDLSGLQTMPLTLSSSVQESLKRDNPIDLYEFALADRQRVNFELSGLGADADLRLLDGDRKEIANSSNVGIVQESIAKNLEQGTYFLEVSGDATSYRLVSQTSDQKRINLYSGDGLLSKSGTVSPIQIPLPEAQVRAIATALDIPFDLVPPSFIAPRDARESLIENSTNLNTELFNGESTGLVGYISHALDSSNVEVLSLFPVPILDVGLLPINSAINLDKELGYTLEFSVSIDSIFTDSPAASGFNVVVIGNDGTTGIELGWTGSEVISRASDFSIAARSPLDPKSLTMYSLFVSGNGYRLEADGSVILSGLLQQYQFSQVSAEPIIPYNPYMISDYIFIGDNYDNGRSTFSIDSLSLYL